MLLLSATTTLAQTKTINGVVRKETNLKEGKIIIYLPDDIRAGDMISGTVVTEPNGKTEKEKRKNRELLLNYETNIPGVVFTPVKGDRQPINFIMPGKQSQLISRSNDKVIQIINFPIPVSSNPLQSNTNITVPTHALAGDPFRITGPFDGDASNTKCRLDGSAMEILAESPRQIICTAPQTTSGKHNITIEEKGKTTENKISIVNMELSAPKTKLLKGESTRIDVKVTGLDGIQSNINITITNTSPSIINLSGGNTQTIAITPSQVATTGIYTQSFPVQSLTTGDFTVNVELKLPEPEKIPQAKM